MFDAPFPEISEARDKPAAAGSHPVQQQAIAASAVAKVDLLALALSRFGAWRAGATALVERYRAVAFDLSTPKGYAELTKAITEVRAPRFAAQNVSKASKSELAGISKAIGAEEAAVAAFLADTETRLVALRDAHDEKVKAEKAEAKRLEDECVAKHQTGIATIRSFLGRCQGLPAARIALGIEQLQGQAYSADDWQEFAVPAASAQCETLEAMRTLHAHAVEHEAEAVRLDAQRLENERVAAEQAAQQAELDRQAAEHKANMARIASLQARVAEIRAAATGHDKASAADLHEARTVVAALDVSEANYQEFAAWAQAEKATTLAVLDQLAAALAARRHAAAESEPAPVTEPQPEALSLVSQAGVGENPGQPQPASVHMATDVAAVGAGDCTATAGETLLASPVAAGVTTAADPVSVLLARIKSTDAMAASNQAALSASPAQPATINLGDICGRLGFTVSGAFLGNMLHIHPAANDKRAQLYTETQFQTICRMLSDYVGAVAESFKTESEK